ncbi:hypothetical protein [Ferruginibacter profundus]
MNTYNDNLHSNVVASLNNQELELKNVKAELDTSIFSLYYAEGKRITAAENLEKSGKRYSNYKKIYDTAVIDHNLSVNVLAAANDFKQHGLLATSNMAVAAANVEIAKNAIVRLAGTMGGIFNILSAADYGSDIYEQSVTANNLMKDTAYDAEDASNVAMQASSLMAEVSASTVAADAKTTDDSVAGLLTALTGNFNDAAAEVTQRNTELSVASDQEKAAEGEVEYINADYYAAQSAYNLTNNELNLNLSVAVKDELSYTVSFDAYKSAYIIDDTNKPLPPGYPVKDYYIMVVKNRAQSTFGLADAEAIKLRNNRQFIKINANQAGDKITKDILITAIKDSDDQPLVLGTSYVIFVMAVLCDEYKTVINNFNNYLTAASAEFKLTVHLHGPSANHIEIKEEDQDVDSVDKKQIEIKEKIQVLDFKVAKDLSNHKVEYRCMFLPDQSSLVADLLTEAGLRKIEDEAEKLADLAGEYIPQINELKAAIKLKKEDKLPLEEKLVPLFKEVKVIEDAIDMWAQNWGPESEKEILKLNILLDDVRNKIEEQEVQIRPIEKDIADLNKKLQIVEKEQSGAKNKLMRRKNLRPGFFFNLKLAEQVSSANYIVPLPSQITSTTLTTGDNDESQRADKKGRSKKESKENVVIEALQIKIPILDNVTDNFGNPLIRGNAYIPVVLTYSTEMEEILDQFTNDLSDFTKTKSFDYKALHKINYTIKKITA